MAKPSAKIAVLSDEVINKIAAGEVVDRPASVLKELMENAMDAGAKSVDVAIVDGGRKAIVVSDTGCGMSRDDALLCLERHATSKIREAEDIDRIATFGFRGEALAAIAAVSRLTLVTRRAEDAGGTEVVVAGGRVVDVRDAGCPAGTSIAARNLFFNVPARRRFLRSDQTELAHLRQVFLMYALSHPGVALSLTVDDREVHRLGPAAGLEDRLRELFGSALRDAVRPVDVERDGVHVRGFASLPHTHRADRSEQYVFVNRRPASAPVVGFAIGEAYQNLVPKGRHPVVFLFLEMDPSMVDVNVHPTKKEVRFRQPTAVRDAIAAGIRAALSLAPAEEQSAVDMPKLRELFTPSRPPPVLQVSDMPALPAFPYPRMTPGVGAAPRVDDVPPQTGGPRGDGEPASAPVDREGSDAPWSWCRILGQIGGLYVIMETEDGMVMMDPQAAHERVLFEKLMGQAGSGRVAVQGLLAPATVSLPPEQARRVRKHLPLIRTMGLGVEEFGGDTFVVDAIPACLGALRPETLLADLAQAMEQGVPRGKTDVWLKEQVAVAACRTAVTSRDKLTVQEIERLVADLARCEMPYTSPRGRPTVIFTSLHELARKFGRE